MENDETLAGKLYLNWNTIEVKIGDVIGSAYVVNSAGVVKIYNAIWTGNECFKLVPKEEL